MYLLVLFLIDKPIHQEHEIVNKKDLLKIIYSRIKQKDMYRETWL